MNKKRSGNRGFTLIEILIVVVVVGILASLILPRMLAAPEKAMILEANQMLGTIIRAQQTNIDTGGAYAVISDNTNSSAWARLGMQPPGTSVVSGAGAKFDYTCPNPLSSLCVATRSGQGGTCYITLTLNGTWSCTTGGCPNWRTMTNGGCTAG